MVSLIALFYETANCVKSTHRHFDLARFGKVASPARRNCRSSLATFISLNQIHAPAPSPGSNNASSPMSLLAPVTTTMSKQPQCPKRRPGRPPTYIFNKPDAELSENERRLKGSVIKRRLRQNRSYHKKKRLRQIAAQSQPQLPYLSHTPILPASSPQPLHLPLSLPPHQTHSAPLHSPLPPFPISPLPSNHNTRISSDQDRDEQTLLEHILGVSTPTLPQSSAIIPHPSTPSFLASDLLSRLSTLPTQITHALKHLLLFPASFTAEAARHISAVPDHSPLTFPTQVLQPLIDANLIRPLPSGRYELNELSKSVLTPQSYAAARDARNRFVQYFSNTLRNLDPHSLSLDGDERLKAMKVYDAERINVTAALHMCRDIGGKNLVMQFLTNAATVMRYSTSAHERTEIFETVLHEAQISPPSSSSNPAEEARITLALGEAYFDLLSFEKAKSFLQRAIGMMAGSTDHSFASISTSVLALLLFAELQISEREFEEARKLLIQALRTLREAGMQKSTFAVCCLLSLASVYSSLGQSGQAMATVQTSLEILVQLGFKTMPIYADALRTLGGVHLDAGDSRKAQDTFFSALTIIQKWISRADWEKAPFQHCTHLDIFLVEAIAKTYSFQHRHDEAQRLCARAGLKRIERRLDSGSAAASNAGGFPSSPKSRMYTRHLY